MQAVLSGKLAARREDCAPVAGKSTLNWLKLSRLEPTHKISHNPVAIKRLFVELFLDARPVHRRAACVVASTAPEAAHSPKWLRSRSRPHL